MCFFRMKTLSKVQLVAFFESRRKFWFIGYLQPFAAQLNGFHIPFPQSVGFPFIVNFVDVISKDVIETR